MVREAAQISPPQAATEQPQIKEAEANHENP
jgi:hypothetical protein